MKRGHRRGPEDVARGDNNNTFTWSGPNGVVGFTGQRRVAPVAGEVHVRLTQVALLHPEEPLTRPLEPDQSPSPGGEPAGRDVKIWRLGAIRNRKVCKSQHSIWS
jgi:hypothetical protein